MTSVVNTISGNPGVPVVILAGGKAKPELKAVIGVDVRALAVVFGKTLLDHVVDGLSAAPGVGEMVVVGNVPASDRYAVIPDGGDFVTNIIAGVEKFKSAEYVVVCTSDLPYLNGESVQAFVDEAIKLAQQSGGQMIYPIVEVAECYKRFPGIKRTARKLKEGAYTGGNLMLIRPEFVLSQRQRIADAYDARKSPARIAAMLGYGTLVRLILSQTISPSLLTVSLLEQRASSMLGGAVRALVTPYPEIATDLDKPSDFTALPKQ